MVVRDVLKGFKASPIELAEEGFASYSKQATYLIASVSDDEKDAIEGTALEVSEEELSFADGYEPDEYKRAKVTLESGKQAWIYVKAE
jgi:Gamma-glutamyl cyclotransferase, AIG2-like